MSIKKAIDSFCLWVEARRRPNTVKCYMGIINRFADFIKEKKIENIGLDDIIKFSKSRAVSDTTIQLEMRVLRQLFLYLEKINKEAPFDPELIPIQNNVESKSYKPVTEQEFKDMLDRADQDEYRFAIRNKLIMRLLYDTGVRVSELVRLEVSDLDMDNQSGRIVCKKNNSPKPLVWSDNTQELIEQYMPLRDRIAKDTDVLILSFSPQNKGESVSKRTIENVVKKYRSHDDIVPHSFRHSLGVRCAEKGYNMNTIKKIMGHKSLSSTEIYMQVNNKMIEDKYKAII